MKKDPVCNMEVDEKSALTAECDGEVYYFCSGANIHRKEVSLWHRTLYVT